MKLNVILIFLFDLFCGFKAVSQDYIITWQNDTIPCTLPGDAKEIGLKPTRNYHNGYERITAIFQNDSLRVINAGEIFGYFRQKHGKKLLCDGYFEAKQIEMINSKKRTFIDEKKNMTQNKTWFFMNRVVEGKYASLFSTYEDGGDTFDHFYYLHRHGIEHRNTVIPIYNYKKMVEMLSEKEIAVEMQRVNYRKSKKGILKIVNEYNRLKEVAAKK